MRLRSLPKLLRPALFAAGVVLGAPSALAQATVPALLLSDIHLDPFHDPAKVARLNAAPASEWPAILAQPDSPNLAALTAQLQQSCAVRGADTPDALWRSSLRAIRTETATAHPRFITVSGDLLAHKFDCKYTTLLPHATHADFADFTEKAIRYIMSSLEAAVPNTPVYLALGNNDSACSDYQLAPAHDDLLAATARIAAETLPPADRPEVLASFPETGSYAAPLAGVPDTRILVLDDLFLSAQYAACGGARDAAPGQAQLAWLSAQLADARQQHQRVWVLGHIPPSIDVYTTARKLTNVCGGAKPVLFLSSSKLADILAANTDVVRLALFGHTHNDEFQFIPAADSAPTPDSGPTQTPPAESASGVPLKLTASISPVNGNRPSFTVAEVNPAAATLKDFTVYEASNATGVGTAWTREYTYSAAYHEPAFDARSVSSLIDSFQSDPSAQQPASKAYLRNYFPGDLSTLLQFAWPEYACSMNHASPAGFAACICTAAQTPPAPAAR